MMTSIRFSLRKTKWNERATTKTKGSCAQNKIDKKNKKQILLMKECVLAPNLWKAFRSQEEKLL